MIASIRSALVTIAQSSVRIIVLDGTVADAQLVLSIAASMSMIGISGTDYYMWIGNRNWFTPALLTPSQFCNTSCVDSYAGLLPVSDVMHR